FVTHLGVYKTEVVRRLGGFRQGLEGSQDWDLALRVTERLDPSKIRHIPRILYHWRVHPGSTASGPAAKFYAVGSSIVAVKEHLDRQGVRAGVSSIAVASARYLRVTREVPSPAPLVTIIIPTRDGRYFRSAIESIKEKTSYKPYDLLIIDNASRNPEFRRYLSSIEKD
ncbi:glycosyl transferase, group 2 family protein, partial [mine drainage metagenome]